MNGRDDFITQTKISPKQLPSKASDKRAGVCFGEVIAEEERLRECESKRYATYLTEGKKV